MGSIVEQVEDMFGFGTMVFGEMRGPISVTMSLQPIISFDHPDLSAGQEQGEYWGSSAFIEKSRALVNAVRARLCLSPLPGMFRSFLLEWELYIAINSNL